MTHLSEFSNTQDTSVQAMTEVALGLSMAFFALLILALISISLPTKQGAPALDVSAQISLAKQEPKKAKTSEQTDAESSDKPPFIVLHWAGQFVDVTMHPINIHDIEQQKNIVIAVDAQISFSQLVSIQNQFKGQEMRLTALTEEWRTALMNAR